jgi:phytoene desaturase
LKPKAIVVGSGIAGLASALRLAKKNCEVQVFESSPHAGGKIHSFSNTGFRFDFGPSLFTMPHLVDELFELFDIDPKSKFEYLKKDVICNYFWDDGTRFSAPADEQKFIEQAATTFSTNKKTLGNYLKQNGIKYDLTAPIFLNKSLHSWRTYLSIPTLRTLFQSHKLDLSSTLDKVNKKHFSNPKLIQLFNRYATYNGSSPYATSGIMSMIPHLEMSLGTYFPKGGMHEISQSLYRLALEVGVNFNFNEPVLKINHDEKQVLGVTTSTAAYQADMVVSNMDIFSTFKKLIPQANQPKRILRQERSSSAIIFYWGIDRSFPDLDLHNIFFSNDYKSEFDCIFKKHKLHNDPTIYINITSKEKKDDAPNGCENWFVMINTPHDAGQNWPELLNQSRANIIRKLNHVLHIEIEKHIVIEDTNDPIQIEQLTGSHLGSLYGTSSNSTLSTFLRHSNFSCQFENLFFCGGSVHPGGGIPLCLLSAKIATDQIKSHV